MSPFSTAFRRLGTSVWFLLVATAATTAANSAHGQGFGFGGQAVGGISIDTEGMIRRLDPKVSAELAAERRAAIAAMEAGGGKAPLRKVSLARLVEAVERCSRSGEPLPLDLLFMGGLEKITHLFVDPDGHDIILAGPADAAIIDDAGTVLAAQSGRPLLRLEDFIVALRSIDGVRSGGVRCSIDPSPEGVAKLQRYLRSLKGIGNDPDATLRSMEDVLGPQTVSVGGVPADSRFAHVLVAADYSMKRIGMGLEPSGVEALPSYVSMIPAGGTSGATLPRFWLEATYEPIVRDADELAWQIKGRGMKCMTESDMLAKGGTIERGRAPADAIAAQWCGAMTAHYDELARRQPVFAELVNCVDLAVVAALIQARQLDSRAGIDLAPLRDAGRLSLPTYETPATVSTVASGLKKGSRWIVTASGGVQFQPWQFATQTTESDEACASRVAALETRPADRWWWD
jgi:hypothetical protein